MTEETQEMCSIVDDLPTLEKKITIDTIAALIYIAGYVICKEEQTEDTYFLYENYGGLYKRVESCWRNKAW